MKNIENIKPGVQKTIGIIVAILITIGILFVLLMYWLTYHSEVEPTSYMEMYEDVDFSYVGRNLYFDGPGEDALFVFYQGALVETESYTPLLARLANAGVDCVAVHAPLNLPVLSNYDAGSVIEDERFSGYKYHYVGGHSLGGYYVTDYAFNNTDKIDGLIHLAAYGNKDYKSYKLPVLSIYGSCDKVLDIDALTISDFFMPDDITSICIDGANHSQFGCYGKQKGDGKAAISAKEQWNITTNEICSFINRTK